MGERRIQLCARGEVALARWQLAAAIGLQSWLEAAEDAEALARETHPLGPAWLELAPSWTPSAV